MPRLTRSQAARLLREARQAVKDDSPRAGELVGWACAAVGDSSVAARMKIDHLLRTHQYDSADALMARFLMQKGDHALIRWRYARSLYEQGRLPQARAEIDKTLEERPTHAGVLILAARLAAAMNDQARAVALLTIAADAHPERRDIGAQLIQTMLDAGMIGPAAKELAFSSRPSPILRSRVLRAQGRMLEAIEVLANCVENGRATDAILCELIDVLEAAGLAPRVRELLTRLSADHPLARLRAARALISNGAFDEAEALIDELCVNTASPAARRDALALRLVICAAAAHPHDSLEPIIAAAGEYFRAQHAASATPRCTQSSSQALADLWLRGLTGACIAEQTQARTGCGDPSISILQPLLTVALHQFDRALTSNEAADAGIDRQVIERLQSICIAARGARPSPIAQPAPAPPTAHSQTPAAQPLRRAA